MAKGTSRHNAGCNNGDIHSRVNEALSSKVD